MKYIWCLLVIALASQAKAQLRCIQCNNCAEVPATPVIVTCTHPLPPGVTTTTTPGGTTTPAGTTSPTPQPPPTLTPQPGPEVTQGPTPPNTPATPPVGPTLTPPPNTDAPGNTPAPTQAPPVTVTQTTTTVDPNAPTFTPASVNKVRRSADVDPFAAHFSCFRIRVPTGTQGQTQINRGCVANTGTTERTCREAANQVANHEDCQLCWENECNSSSGLFSSIFLVISSVFIAIRML